MWEFAYVEKLKSKGSNPLFFEKGSYAHELLHLYYSLVKAGYPVGSPILIQTITDRVKVDLQEEISRAAEDKRAPDIDFYRDISKAILHYVKAISPKIDSKIDLIEHEYHLEHLNEEFDVTLHGYIDLLYYDTIRKQWAIRDHKTGAKNTWTNQKVEEDIQLLFYGTLWYILTGEVARVEINFICSKPPSKPSASTVLYGLFEAHHTAKTYQSFWEYLQLVLVRMSNPQTLQNLAICSSCAYKRICRAGLRGYSADQIKKANFNGPHNKPIIEVQEQDSLVSGQGKKPFSLALKWGTD
jgi:hypothetical protein